MGENAVRFNKTLLLLWDFEDTFAGLIYINVCKICYKKKFVLIKALHGDKLH